MSDLDGTLLNRRSEISDFTTDTINRLLKNGLLFSVATARSIGTAFEKTSKLHLNLPISLMNGVFLCYQNNPDPVAVFPFPKEEAAALLRDAMAAGASPFFYQYDPGIKKLLLQYVDFDYPPRAHFYQLRKDSLYKKFIHSPTPTLYKGCIPLYINFLDEYDVLLRVKAIADTLKGIQSIFYFDPVLQAWYLEIFSAMAGKAAGVKKLAQIARADKIVVFGDNGNDLSMFAAADQSCAVENAPKEIQAAATTVISSCDHDGVARFLLQYEHHSV